MYDLPQHAPIMQLYAGGREDGVRGQGISRSVGRDGFVRGDHDCGGCRVCVFKAEGLEAVAVCLLDYACALVVAALAVVALLTRGAWLCLMCAGELRAIGEVMLEEATDTGGQLEALAGGGGPPMVNQNLNVIGWV